MEWLLEGKFESKSGAQEVAVLAIAIGTGGLEFDSRVGKSDTGPTAFHRCDVSLELYFSGAKPRR